MQTAFSFRGCIGPKCFALGIVIINVALVFNVLAFLGSAALATRNGFGIPTMIVLMIFFGVIALCLLWSCYALSAKRLHDMGYSGWHLLWIAILFSALSTALNSDLVLLIPTIIMCIMPRKA